MDASEGLSGDMYELPASGLFPATRRDWLLRLVEGGDPGRKTANAFVMELYAPSLAAYLRGSSFRTIGDGGDLVAGYFASRLDRADFFQRWLASNLPFRRWLINGFIFFLHEEIRRQRGRNENDVDEELLPEPEAVEHFDRVWVREVVRRACERAGEICAAGGKSTHWTLFMRHHVHGVEYTALEDETGVSPSRAPGMVRTAADVFRRAVLEILVRDGVPAKELDDELRRLLAATGRERI
ncbi:MAG: hypothetical protein SGJ09_04890 [Phycisphaerae bacterium]|nr:hypothetical protein [Phycisphaerae bacterium]